MDLAASDEIHLEPNIYRHYERWKGINIMHKATESAFVGRPQSVRNARPKKDAKSKTKENT